MIWDDGEWSAEPDPDPVDWPAGVKRLSQDALAEFGVDDRGGLWWRGKPVQVRRSLDLSRWQAAFVIVAAISTAIGAAAAVATASHEWAAPAARYSMVNQGGGVALRLDRQTGDVIACKGLHCEPKIASGKFTDPWDQFPSASPVGE